MEVWRRRLSKVAKDKVNKVNKVVEGVVGVEDAEQGGGWGWTGASASGGSPTREQGASRLNIKDSLSQMMCDVSRIMVIPIPMTTHITSPCHSKSILHKLSDNNVRLLGKSVNNQL